MHGGRDAPAPLIVTASVSRQPDRQTHKVFLRAPFGCVERALDHVVAVAVVHALNHTSCQALQELSSAAITPLGSPPALPAAADARLRRTTTAFGMCHIRRHTHQHNTSAPTRTNIHSKQGAKDAQQTHSQMRRESMRQESNTHARARKRIRLHTRAPSLCEGTDLPAQLRRCCCHSACVLPLRRARTAGRPAQRETRAGASPAPRRGSAAGPPGRGEGRSALAGAFLTWSSLSSVLLFYALQPYRYSC
jgi:hypothetical protein